MKLFLASEGSDPLTTQKLDKFVSGLKNKKVAYIPTAKNGNGEGGWSESNSWQYLLKNSNGPECIELENYLHGIDRKLFKNKDVIWITGGAAGYLMYWVLRTGFNELLPELLKEKIYVGSSAGAMITGPDLRVCDWYIDENEKGASNIPSLNLVDFDIYPHYDDIHLEKIKENYKGNKLYLLKNGEEIIVEDGKVTVIGEERIIKGTP